MSEYNVVIRRDGDDYEVWLDAAEGVEPDTNAMVLGSGETRDAALTSAALELQAAIDRVNRALTLTHEALP